MKKIIYLFILNLSILSAQAQPPRMGQYNRPPMRNEGGLEMNRPQQQRTMTKEQRAQLESFRIQFITKKLDLTPAEAEKFWPVYNEQNEASRGLMKEKKDDEIEFQEAMLVIRKKFKKDLMPILKTEERVNIALKVDRELLHKMRNEMMRRKKPM